MRIVRLLFGLVSVVAACTMRHGQRAERFEVAQTPRGLVADVRLGTLRLKGELVTANDSVLVIDTGTELVRLRIGDVRRLRLEQRGRAIEEYLVQDLHDGRGRERLRYRSRFPHGMSAHVESRLLEARQQERVRDVVPTGNGSASAEEFVRRSRAAGNRYADRRRAIEDGYRRLGPDFPFMGEHWVQPGLVVSGVVDADRPPVLTYVRCGDTILLTGVAFSMPLRDHEPTPTVPVAGVWHDHTGALDEEGFALHSAASGAMPHGSRLAMLHVWTALPNPDGIFAQDNPAVAFARHGVAMPGASRVASRAATLGAGGHLYYARMIRRSRSSGAAPSPLIDSVLARAGAEVDRWLVEQGRGRKKAKDLRRLEQLWTKVWEDVSAHAPPESAALLHQLRAG